MERIVQNFDFAQISDFAGSWGELLVAAAALICTVIIASAQNRIALIERRYAVYSEIKRIVSFGSELKVLVEQKDNTPLMVLRRAMVAMGWGSCVRKVPKLGYVIHDYEMDDHRYNTELIVKQADSLFPSINKRTLEDLLVKFEECLEQLYNEYSSEGEIRVLEKSSQLEQFWTECECGSVRRTLLVMELNLRYGFPPFRWVILLARPAIWGTRTFLTRLKNIVQNIFIRKKATKKATNPQEQETTVTASEF